MFAEPGYEWDIDIQFDKFPGNEQRHSSPQGSLLNPRTGSHKPIEDSDSKPKSGPPKPKIVRQLDHHIDQPAPDLQIVLAQLQGRPFAAGGHAQGLEAVPGAG